MFVGEVYHKILFLYVIWVTKDMNIDYYMCSH